MVQKQSYCQYSHYLRDVQGARLLGDFVNKEYCFIECHVEPETNVDGPQVLPHQQLWIWLTNFIFYVQINKCHDTEMCRLIE